MNPHIRLAVDAIGLPAASLQRTVDSCRHLIDSALVVIAPKGYNSLPHEGFGYCALETSVVQFHSPLPLSNSELVKLASTGECDWILILAAGDTVPSTIRLIDLPLTHPGVSYIAIATGHLVRAGSDFRFHEPLNGAADTL